MHTIGQSAGVAAHLCRALQRFCHRRFAIPSQRGHHRLEETARRQIEALGEARKTLLRLDVLGVPREESLARIKEIGFRPAAIDQIANNYYLPTMPSAETITRAATSPGAKGQGRVTKVIKSTAETYGSSTTKRVPLLPE